jgi:hypothetical protein
VAGIRVGAPPRGWHGRGDGRVAAAWHDSSTPGAARRSGPRRPARRLGARSRRRAGVLRQRLFGPAAAGAPPARSAGWIAALPGGEPLRHRLEALPGPLVGVGDDQRLGVGRRDPVRSNQRHRPGASPDARRSPVRAPGNPVGPATRPSLRHVPARPPPPSPVPACRRHAAARPLPPGGDRAIDRPNSPARPATPPSPPRPANGAGARPGARATRYKSRAFSTARD